MSSSPTMWTRGLESRQTAPLLRRSGIALIPSKHFERLARGARHQHPSCPLTVAGDVHLRQQLTALSVEDLFCSFRRCCRTRPSSCRQLPHLSSIRT